MTNQQLHRLYEQKAPSLEPYITRTTSSEDLVQEARIGLYKALKKNPLGTFAYLRNGARWQMIDAAKRGKSIDNGKWKRDQFNFAHLDHLNYPDSERVFSLVINNNRVAPLDELVLDKIGVERFYAKLTELEKRIVDWKLEGCSDRRVRSQMRISVCLLKEIKKSIRNKMCVVFTG